MPTSSSGAGRPCSGDKVAVSGGRPCGSANTSVYSDSNFNNLGSSEGVESALGVVTSPRHSFLRRPPPPITLSHCPTSAGDYRTTAADPRTPPLNTTSSMVACRLLEEVEVPAVMPQQLLVRRCPADCGRVCPFIGKKANKANRLDAVAKECWN